MRPRHPAAPLEPVRERRGKRAAEARFGAGGHALSGSATSPKRPPPRRKRPERKAVSAVYRPRRNPAAMNV